MADQSGADVSDVDASGAGRESRSPRSVRLGDAREQEILRATYELLAEVGYEGLRFDAVAARARASKATLYRHWPAKAQLVADAVRGCRAAGQECPDTGSLRGDLAAFMETMAASMKSEDGPLFAGVVMAMLHDTEFAADMRGLQEYRQSTAAAMHARAVSRGELGADSNAGLIEEIAPALMFMQLVRGEPLDGRFITHLVDDIVMPALTHRKSPEVDRHSN